MSIKTITCAEAYCDECGSECWSDTEYGTPHFTSIEAAREELVKHYDWTVTDDEQICQRCANQRICAAEGHDWRPWINGARSFTGTQHRWCDREGCDGYEERPIPSKFPEVGPR